MIAKFTFNYNGGFEKKENAVFQQGSIGVDSYQVFAPFLTTTQVYIKTKRNGDLEFSLWKQLDYNSTIGGWLKTATQDELLVDGEMKIVFKFNNLVSQETSLWVRKGTLIVPEMTTYEALRDYVESVDGRIDQLLAGETAVHHVQFDNTLVDGDVTDKPSIMYDSYEKMFRAINDDDTDIVIGGELQKLVRNENSGDLAEGTIVSISGAVGQRVTIDKFDITSEFEHARIPAVITKSGVIALHGLGKVSFFGEIKGLPIANFEVTGTAYAEGQPLYCSINSKITNVTPAKPNLHVHIGTLERIVGTTANVFIHTLVIPHFSHLSDVVTTNPLNGQIWYYESATKTFKNTNYFRVIGDKVAINQPNAPRKNLDLGGSFILTGSIQFADTLTESDGRVKIYQSNGFVNVRNFNDDYTILKIWSKPGAVGNDREATIALVRGDNEEEFIDLYNNGYTSETQHGIRIQKRGTGQYRDFVFDHYDGVTKTPVFILKADGKVGVGTNTPSYKFDVVGDGRFSGVVIATNITDITNRVEALETANMIKSYTYNPSTHVLTFTYYDNTTTSFDLPLESAIVDASYDSVTKDITFTLQSGATLVVPLDDIISGLASETWVTTYFIPKTALKTSFSATPLDTNVISEKLAKDTFDEVEARVDTLETFKNTTENTLQTLKEKDSEIELKVTTIEEAYRKSQNGELTATKFDTDNISLGKDVAPAPLQVKVDGGLLEAKQLVTNGDFSDGNVGFVLNDLTFNVVSQVGESIATAPLGRVRTPLFTLLSGVKYYAFTVQKAQSPLVRGLFTDGTNNYFLPYNNGNNSFQVLSVIATAGGSNLTGASIQFVRDERTSGWNTVYTKQNGYFNISTLIANKIYSPLYNKTFDLMSDAEIKAQMDLWVQNGTLPNDNVLAVGMNKRVRSVGKNLFDKSKAILNGYYDGDGIFQSNSDFFSTDFVLIRPSTEYIHNRGNVSFINYYDIDKNWLSSSLSTSFTTPNNAYYVKIMCASNDKTIDTFQLELGSTATSYVPYANTDLYLQPNKVGYKLPNGVADTVEYRNGKYYYVQRVKKYVLQASDVVFLVTSPTNVDYIQFNGSILTGGNYSTLSVGNERTTYIEGFNEITGYINWDDAQNIGRYSVLISGVRFTLIVAKGTYANLAEAQTALAGTAIYYQLATPIETEILAFGNAQGLAGGTTYIDDIMADSNLYTSKYDIENTAYRIKSLDRIVKINADGSQTELAVSSAVVAGDGLSFTHPSLVANDIVWIAYSYNVANLFKSNTFVTYYDNPFIAVQPNGTPRRIVFTVNDSGVVTVSSVAV